MKLLIFGEVSPSDCDTCEYRRMFQAPVSMRLLGRDRRKLLDEGCNADRHLQCEQCLQKKAVNVRCGASEVFLSLDPVLEFGNCS